MTQGPVTPKIPSVTTTLVAENSHEHDERHSQCRHKNRFGSQRTLPGRRHSVRAARRAARFFGALALPLLLCGSVRAAESASLAWNPSTTPGVAGYAFYFGSQSGVYTSRFDVGTNTDITLTGLTAGATNYFSVTAYNTAHIESPNAAEVAYIVPGLARLIPPTQSGSPMTVSFPVAPGHSYSVQASTNLKTWATIYTTGTESTNAWITWQDTQSKSYASRFYRLIMN